MASKENKEWFYQGLFRPPEYIPETAYEDLFVGYRIPTAKLGATTSAFTVNQIMEVTSRLNTGMKFVEAGPISPDVFEKIPEQHFKEINRLAKLAKAEITWHAPIVDPAGLFEEGKITEEQRKENEALLWDAIQKAVIATGGGQPITIHSTAGIPANFIKRKGEEGGVAGVVNVLEENVRLAKLESIPKPELIAEGKEIKPLPYEKFIEERNNEIWLDTLDAIAMRKIDIAHHITTAPPELAIELSKKREQLEESYALRYFGKKISELNEKEKRDLYSIIQKEDVQGFNIIHELEKKEADLRHSKILFDDFVDKIERIFEVAWKASEFDKEKREKLKEIAKEITYAKKISEKNTIDSLTIFTGVIENLKEVKPKILMPAEDFAREKASETISNLAVKAYEKFKDKAPILGIENLFPNLAFSQADQLKKLIEKSREKFVEKMKDKLGEGRARKLAEQMIGATWDIGHINLLRKYGYGIEEIKAELEKIKPFIKHVHLTDNFGFTDSHLPPGMAGVGKEIFAEIKELVEKKGIKAAIEAAVMALPPPQGFGTSPYPISLAALGSPLYTYEMAPFWNQALAGGVPAYFTGYGPILPEQHFTIYGSGFSGLPSELGGQAGRKGFSEVPAE